MTQKIALIKTIKELDRRGFNISINDINEIKAALKWFNKMNGMEEDIDDDKPFNHIMAIVETFEYENGISNFF